MMSMASEKMPISASDNSKAALQKACLPWVEKYRPNSLDDLVSQNDIVCTIKKFMDEKRVPHLLFYGPPGTGKTSTVLACAKTMYGPQYYKSMILELNASDERGIDVVREQIKDFVSTRKICNDGVKLVILDEADAMTNAAQMALRRIMEKYTRNARFCIICNYVNKIIPALQSRCTRFRFSPLKLDQIQQRLYDIAAAEGVTMTQDGALAVLKLCQGDMRKALNLMQSTAAAFQLRIDENTAYTCAAQPTPSEVRRIIEMLSSDTFSNCFANLQTLKTEKGFALIDILREAHIQVMTMAKFTAENRQHFLERFAELEYNLVSGSEKIQLAAFIGIFKQIK